MRDVVGISKVCRGKGRKEDENKASDLENGTELFAGSSAAGGRHSGCGV